MFLKLENSSYEVVFYTISLLVYIKLTIFNTLYTLSMNFYLFENRNMNLMLNIDIISLLLLSKIKEYAKMLANICLTDLEYNLFKSQKMLLKYCFHS